MHSIQLEKNISLSNFTTWRIGGPAEWIAQPTNIEEIKYLINWANKKKIRVFIKTYKIKIVFFNQRDVSS